MNGRRNFHQVLSDAPRALADCLSVIQQEDELLLVDGGVQWLTRMDEMSRGLDELNFGVVLNALEADVASRGLGYTTGLNSVNLLNDRQWIEKVCQFDQVLSWK